MRPGVAIGVPRIVECDAVVKTRPIATTVALLCATFLSSMDVTVVGTAMPRIAGQLGGLELYPWVFSAFMLACTVTVPLFGKLGDLYGRKPTFLVGIVIFLLGSLACGASPTMAWLVAARALQGVGAGAIPALALAIFADIFPVETRARIQGVFSMVWGVSSVIGPMVGGFIVHWWSWRWVFYLNLPVGLVCIALFAAAFHERIEARRLRLDWAGAVLLTTSVSLLLIGLSRPPSTMVPLIVASLALGALFIVVERRAADPLIPLDLFGERVVATSSGAAILSGAITLGYIAYVPLHLQGALGIEPLWAGLLMAPLLFAWTAGSFGGGWLLLRFGFRPVVRGGTLALFVGNALLWLALRTLPSHSGWTMFHVGTVAVGLGMGSTVSAFIISVQDQLPFSRRGVGTALLQFLRQIGSTIGVAVLGALLTSTLAARLAAVPGAPPAGDLLDPAHLANIPASVLQPTRDALATSVTSLFIVNTAMALACWLITSWYPEIHPTRTVESVSLE
jgi:EmrB/QacA subfamily drug resistance transporter